MVSHPNPKAAVTLIREAFEARESSIQTRDAYNLLAQLWGYKDWATAKSVLDKSPRKAPAAEATPNEAPSFAKTADYVKDWPTLVFTNQGGNVDDPLYMYGPGVTLDNLYAERRHWHLINDQKYPVLLVPEAPFENLALHDVLVGEEIACAYWDSEEYGFPAAANEREAHGFLSEELGWGYLASQKGQSLVEVVSRCRGDDGGVEWWVQARVHPELYAKLVKDFTPARLNLEQLMQEKSLQDLLATDASAHPGLATLQQGIRACFAQVGEYTWRDLLDRLANFLETAPSSNALDEDFVLRPDDRSLQTAGGLLKRLQDALERALQELRA